MTTNNPQQPSAPPSTTPAAAPAQPQQQAQQSPSPRARMQALLAIPDRDRSDEEWDELNELEILMAPGNREGAPMPTGGRRGAGPMQSGRREQQSARPGGSGGGGAGNNPGGQGPGGGPGGNPQGKRQGGKKFHRGPRKPNTPRPA